MRTARRRDATLFLVLLLASASPASAGQHERITTSTNGALRRFDEWFGPMAERRLSLDVAGRWWSSETDASPERAIIVKIARQFWSTVATTDAVFSEGLARYTAARVINDVLEGRHLTTYRFFGAFVPYTVRSVSLSRPRRDPRPLVRRFPEFTDDERGLTASWMPTRDDADRWAEALHSLERFIGWPAMQQALNELAQRHSGGNAGASAFAAIVGEQRGAGVDWFASTAGSAAHDIDYIVDAFASTMTPASAYETVIHLRREGTALFPLPVLTQFADGTQQRDAFGVASARLELHYQSAAAAVRVSIDPDTVLVLDTNRANNVSSVPRRLPAAAERLMWNWLIWLQDLLLTCAAVA